MAKQMRKNELEGAVEVDSEQYGIPEVTADAVAADDAAASSEAGVEAPMEAGVDPAVEAVAAAVGKVAAAKPSRKAKLKAGAAQGEVGAVPNYAALGLSAEDAQEVEALRLAYSELGRRSTEHVFECGAVMDAVHRIAPDQKAFGKLVKEAFGISRTGAENLARVYRNLQPHRARLARLGIAASSLYVMATAEADKVEEVLAVAEGGEKLSVKRVKSMLGIDEARPGAVADDGGPAGLRARIAEKTAIGVKQVMDDAEQLLTMTLVLVHDHSQGKRLVIKDIERPFRYPARLLRERLRWLTLLAVPAPKGAGEGAIHQKPPSESQKWWELLLTLEKLGGSWPKAGEVGGWLADTVAPQLSWLLGDRAGRSQAVIDKMAAEAEAERVKAEQAKARAKADAKTARQKAKREKLKTALREAKAKARATKASGAAGAVALDGSAQA